MTQDEIIRMAREAGFVFPETQEDSFTCWWEELERFFNLAFAAGAANEREKLSNQVKPTVWKNTVDEVRFKETVNSCQKSTELVDMEAAVLAEREACAKVCDDKHDYMCSRAAAAIRARGM